MSEKPEKKESPHVTLMVALVGAVATIIAALIQVAPDWFDDDPDPTPTATPTPVLGRDLGTFGLPTASLFGGSSIISSLLSATAFPSPTPARMPLPTPTPTPSRVPVLLSDNFDNPNVSRIPTIADFPEHYQLSVAEGRFNIWKYDARWHRIALVTLPGIYDDASLDIEALIREPGRGRFVHLYCRANANGAYHLRVEPSTQYFELLREDEYGAFVLASGTSTLIGPPGQFTRLFLGCNGSRITVQINGTLVADKRDTRFQAGNFEIGACSCETPFDATVDAVFDNLWIVEFDP